MENPAVAVKELALGYAAPRCLHMIAEMGVADALGEDSRTAADLAASTGADSDALRRALRLLSAYGVFAPCEGGYVHTPASRLLRTDHPQSLRSYARSMGNPLFWKSFELLDHSLRTGEAAAEQVTPGGIWAYFQQHPEEGRVFDEAMTGKGHVQLAGVLSNYDFTHFGTIADIGGGRGHLLQAVLSAAPGATGVLFDQPHVVEQSVAASSRLKLQAGDFFKDALPASDAYLLMNVIHDWNDADAIRILTAVRQAAPAHARLLLIEAVVPENLNPDWIKMIDIFMLALLASKERTSREYEHLFAASGFRLDRVIDAGLGTSILEASAT